jgi:hypothetical protein
MAKIKIIDKRSLNPIPRIRVDGYYYVLTGKRWQIALYEQDSWYLPGVAGEFEERDFEKIGARPVATLKILQVVDLLNDPIVKKYLNKCKAKKSGNANKGKK